MLAAPHRPHPLVATSDRSEVTAGAASPARKVTSTTL